MFDGIVKRYDSGIYEEGKLPLNQMKTNTPLVRILTLIHATDKSIRLKTGLNYSLQE